MYVCMYLCMYIHTQMYVCMSIHDSDLVIGMQIGIVQFLVAVSCCSVLLQCLVAVFCCSVLLQCLVAVSCSVLLQCLVAVSCCSVLQCLVAVSCCSVLLQCLVAVSCSVLLQYLVAVSCCSVLLQCRVAVSCCCVLQCRVTVCRSALFVVGIQIGIVNAQSSYFLLQRLVAVSCCSVLQCLPHIGIVNAQSSCFVSNQPFEKRPVSSIQDSDLYSHDHFGEGMGANQLCRIVFGISSQIGRDGHRDMGDVSTYGKIVRTLLGSMKRPGSNLCADTRRHKYLRASQRLKTERHLH